MQNFKLSLIAFLAGAAVVQLQAQPASPEQQDRALELLRQTISQEQPATHHQAPSPAVVTPTPSMSPAPVAATPAVTSNDQQQQAIALLRQQMANENRNATVAPAQSKGSKTRSTTKAAPAHKSSKPASSGAAVAQPSVEVAPVVQEQPAGPKTKQQKLMELLERYKADLLTPAEYQAERAKIIAEP